MLFGVSVNILLHDDSFVHRRPRSFRARRQDPRDGRWKYVKILELTCCQTAQGVSTECLYWYRTARSHQPRIFWVLIRCRSGKAKKVVGRKAFRAGVFPRGLCWHLI